MDEIVLLQELCAVIEPHYPNPGNGRPPAGLERMLRMYFVQHWFNLADQTCEKALLDSTALRRFAGIDLGCERLLVHIGTAANVDDVTQAAGPLHGKEKHAWGDAGYQGADKRQEMQGRKAKWHMAMRPGKRKALNPKREIHKLDKAEQLKVSMRARVAHPFRVIKRHFVHAKVRYRGFEKNTARLTMRFALGNLWMARRRIMSAQG